MFVTFSKKPFEKEVETKGACVNPGVHGFNSHHFSECLLQGAAIEFKKGRVAVFGEAAMFSAQLAGPQRRRMGMNNLMAKQNPRFLLNVAHWLSRLIWILL